MKCPCDSNQAYEDCCEKYLKGEGWPDSPEKLMRSRYTAYVKCQIPYLRDTLSSKKDQKEFDFEGSKEWAKNVEWNGLKILSTDKGGPDDLEGVVEFVASYREKGKGIEHHEVAQFKRDSKGNWKYVDGDVHYHNEGEGHHHPVPKIETFVRTTPKIGRNDPCSCGSGKKYKKCCGVG